MGNVVTIGGFYGTVDFDPGIDTFNLTAPTAGIGFFISKFNSQGVFIWAKSIDSLPWYGSFQVLCTNDNSTIVAGHFTNTVDFDPDTSAHFIQACADDYFVAKYDSNGKFIWVKSFCGSYSAISVGLQTDDNKNVFVAGNFIGKVDFNPGPGKANVISKGINDIFIVKLDSNGKFNWLKTFGGKKNDQINSMKIDRFGNIYTIGSFEDKVDFDPAIGIFIDSVMGGSDTFISKLDSGGNFIWAKSFKGIYDEWGFDLDVDSAGNVYSIGVFFDSVDFNPDTTNFSMKSAGFMDVFISKLDSSGNFVWAKSIGGGSNDWGLRIALDASEEIFISGHFYGTSDLNPGVGVYNAVSPNNNLDIFIVKLEGSGDFIKAYTFGDLGSDVISGIAIDKKNVYAVGTFWGVVDFDPGRVCLY
nr:hypothetical protein [Bacteroidota bacterium]